MTIASPSKNRTLFASISRPCHSAAAHARARQVKINTKRAIGIVVAALCLVSTGAGAARRHAHFRRPVHVAPPVAMGVPDVDGRLFGHLPYDEAPPTDLEIVKRGFGLSVP